MQRYGGFYPSYTCCRCCYSSSYSQWLHWDGKKCQVKLIFTLTLSFFGEASIQHVCRYKCDALYGEVGRGVTSCACISECGALNNSRRRTRSGVKVVAIIWSSFPSEVGQFAHPRSPLSQARVLIFLDKIWEYCLSWMASLGAKIIKTCPWRYGPYSRRPALCWLSLSKFWGCFGSCQHIWSQTKCSGHHKRPREEEMPSLTCWRRWGGPNVWHESEEELNSSRGRWLRLKVVFFQRATFLPSYAPNVGDDLDPNSIRIWMIQRTI